MQLKTAIDNLSIVKTSSIRSTQAEVQPQLNFVSSNEACGLICGFIIFA